jgi:hypothetical protein
MVGQTIVVWVSYDTVPVYAWYDTYGGTQSAHPRVTACDSLKYSGLRLYVVP